MNVLGLVLVVVAAVCAFAVIYPYLVYPALLRLLPAVQSQQGTDDPPRASDFAILFCAFNEERSAQAKVENLSRLRERHPDLEIRIYDDASTDRTAEILGTLGPGVVLRSSERAGKATGMARLVASTERDILLFTDANVLLAEDIIDRSAPYFSDPTVGGVCGHLSYDAAEATATQAAGGAYWRLEEAIKRLESRSGSVMGGDGSIFVMRRELYPEVPATAQDDFTATMNVVFEKKRLVVADDVIVRERLVAKSGDEYRRKVRISARAMHTHMKMRDRLTEMSALDRWKYASHKVTRWFGALFLGLGLISGVLGLTVVSPPVGFATLSIVGALGLLIWFVPQLGAIREVIIAVLATGQGVFLALTGATFATWTPPQSR